MNAYGWRSIFKFTLVQQVKTKSFIISSILISVLILAMVILINVLPGLLAPAPGTVEDTPLAGQTKTVYFADASGITASSDYQKLFEDAGLTFIGSDGSDKAEEYTNTVRNGSNSVFVLLTYDENTGYSIKSMRPLDGSVSPDDANVIASTASSAFSELRLEKLGLSEDKIPSAIAPVTIVNTIAGEEEMTFAQQMINSVLPMITSLILFIMIVLYGQLIAQSVAMEKTSKVIDTLLISTRPLAIIIGKILAIGALSLMQFIGFILVGVIGFAATLPLGLGLTSQALAGVDGVGEFTEAFGKLFSQISPLTIIMILVIFILGFLFYALIAGLIGATVSHSEDVNSAMQPFAIFSVIGFYLAYFPSFTEDGSQGMLKTLSYYLPLSSPFSLPSGMLTGQLDILQTLIGVLILAAFNVIIALFVARVYEQLILHTGNRIKIGELFGLAKK